MNAQSWAALILAGLAVVGAIASVNRLAFRVGELVGKVNSGRENDAADRARIWTELSALDARHDKHIEVFHGGYRDHR